MIMHDVILNDAEQRLSKYLAKKKYEQSRKQGIPNMKIGPQSNEVTDLDGVGAEIAFCKLHNIYPNLEVTSADPAYDCVLSDGRTVDVKQTPRPAGRLLATLKKKKYSDMIDLFALMVGELPNYRFVGAMRAADLLVKNRIMDLGHGPTYAADQGELFFIIHQLGD